MSRYENSGTANHYDFSIDDGNNDHLLLPRQEIATPRMTKPFKIISDFLINIGYLKDPMFAELTIRDNDVKKLVLKLIIGDFTQYIITLEKKEYRQA